MATRDLFGGAIKAKIPEDFIDASDLRQIPDTQEVFLARDSAVSFVVEVLQGVDAKDPKEAAEFHFDSVAHDNDATSSKISQIVTPQEDETSSSMSDTPVPILVDGIQYAHKFNRTKLDQVRILMAIYRIKAKGVDLVFSNNIPLSSADDGEVDHSTVERTRTQFMEAVESLKIVNYDLFA